MRILKRLVVAWLSVVGSAVVGAFVVRKAIPTFGDESSDAFSFVTTFGGRTFKSTARNLSEGSVLTMFGGVELDLQGADIGTGATVVLRCIMGGIDVKVPPAWRVELIANEVLAEIGNHTNPDEQLSDAPLLLVDATAIMGGIDIRVVEVS